MPFSKWKTTGPPRVLIRLKRALLRVNTCLRRLLHAFVSSVSPVLGTTNHPVSIRYDGTRELIASPTQHIRYLLVTLLGGRTRPFGRTTGHTRPLPRISRPKQHPRHWECLQMLIHHSPRRHHLTHLRGVAVVYNPLPRLYLIGIDGHTTILPGTRQH